MIGFTARKTSKFTNFQRLQLRYSFFYRVSKPWKWWPISPKLSKTFKGRMNPVYSNEAKAENPGWPTQRQNTEAPSRQQQNNRTLKMRLRGVCLRAEVWVVFNWLKENLKRKHTSAPQKIETCVNSSTRRASCNSAGPVNSYQFALFCRFLGSGDTCPGNHRFTPHYLIQYLYIIYELRGNWMLFPTVLFSFFQSLQWGNCNVFEESTASEISKSVIRRYLRIDKGENWCELSSWIDWSTGWGGGVHEGRRFGGATFQCIEYPCV